MRKPTIFFAALLGCAASVFSLPATAATKGEPIPSCKLLDFDSDNTANLESLKGKVLYVDFWASWCPPCAKSFPFMNELVKAYKDKGLEVIGINLDESKSDAEQFLARQSALFSVVTDPDQTCAQAFDVQAMPSTYLIDHHGNIQHIHFGFRSGDAEKLKEDVERLLQIKGDNG